MMEVRVVDEDSDSSTTVEGEVLLLSLSSSLLSLRGRLREGRASRGRDPMAAVAKVMRFIIFSMNERMNE